MKLKKIASLMLAGVMAVSMLAGCSGKTEEKPGQDENNNSQATGVSTTFAGYLNDSHVKFADNSTYQTFLSDAIKEADLDYRFLGTVTTVKSVDGGVYQAIAKDFALNVVDFDATRIEDFQPNTNSTDNTYMTLYTVPGEVSRDIALKQVAAALNTKLSNSILPNYADAANNKQYNYTYTGSVSMQKVEDGSASAWYVLVTVGIDATEAKK